MNFPVYIKTTSFRNAGYDLKLGLSKYFCEDAKSQKQTLWKTDFSCKKIKLYASQFQVLEYVDPTIEEDQVPKLIDEDLMETIAAYGIDESMFRNYLTEWYKWSEHYVYLSWCIKYSVLTHPELMKWYLKYEESYKDITDVVKNYCTFEVQHESLLYLNFPNQSLEHIINNPDFPDLKLDIFEKMFKEISVEVFWINFALYLQQYNVTFLHSWRATLNIKKFINIEASDAKYLFKIPGRNYSIDPEIPKLKTKNLLKGMIPSIKSWIFRILKNEVFESQIDIYFKPLKNKIKKQKTKKKSSVQSKNTIKAKEPVYSYFRWLLPVVRPIISFLSFFKPLLFYTNQLTTFASKYMTSMVSKKIQQEDTKLLQVKEKQLQKLYDNSTTWIKHLMVVSPLLKNKILSVIKCRKPENSSLISLTQICPDQDISNGCYKGVTSKELTDEDMSQLSDDHIDNGIQFDEDGSFILATQNTQSYDSKIRKIVSPYRLLTQCKPEESYRRKVSEDIKKFYYQRYRLFSKYDDGIQLDNESWYSVTPEALATHHADRFRVDVIVDAFCGAGGNTIQLAFTCNHVIAIDIDPVKLNMAKENAKIYGVEERITFIRANFLDIVSSLKMVDAVFISPPWGGIDYMNKSCYDVYNLNGEINCIELMQKTRQITSYIGLYLPKNSNIYQMIDLAENNESVEIELSTFGNKPKAITAYYFQDGQCD